MYCRTVQAKRCDINATEFTHNGVRPLIDLGILRGFLEYIIKQGNIKNFGKRDNLEYQIWR